MVDKIEKFNTTGEMEGGPTSKNKAKLYSSMKQEVIDMCESKYDSEIRKYCIEQPTEVRVNTCLSSVVYQLEAPSMFPYRY